MRAYISGPMTGHPEFNYPAFESAAVHLRGLGFEVVSPHEINPDDGIEHPWDWYLRRDIVELVTCEIIVMLPGWEASKGATLEEHIAHALGMETFALVEMTSAYLAGVGA